MRLTSFAGHLSQAADGTLAVISDAAHTALHKHSLSVSSAQKIQMCPANWVASALLAEPELPFAMNTLGTAAHAVLEALYQRPSTGRTEAWADAILEHTTTDTWTRHPEWAAATHHDTHRSTLAAINNTFTDLPEIVPAEAAQELWRDVVRVLVRGDFALETPADIDVAATELHIQGVHLPNGVPATGFIDRVDRLPDGTLAIRDYKSGRYRPHNPRFAGRDEKADQIRLYTWMAAAHLGIDRPTTGELLFIGQQQRVLVDCTDAPARDSLTWFGDAWARMQSAHAAAAYQARPDQARALCGWCPLARACPVADLRNAKAAANARTARTARELGLGGTAHREVMTNTSDPIDDFMLEPEPMSPFLVNDADIDHYFAPRPAYQEAPTTMTTTTAPAPAPTVRPEGKTWEETVILPDGTEHLNLNSHAAGRVFGLETLAWGHLKQHTAHVTPAAITTLAQVFASIILDVERRLSGRVSFQTGLNTRISGMLRETLDLFPVPVTANTATLMVWRTQTVRRLEMLANAALSLWEQGEHLDGATTIAEFAASGIAR